MRLCIVGGALQGMEAAFLGKKAGFETVVIDRRPTGNYTREELARGIPFVIDGGTAEYFLLENQ